MIVLEKKTIYHTGMDMICDVCNRVVVVILNYKESHKVKYTSKHFPIVIDHVQKKTYNITMLSIFIFDKKTLGLCI